MTSVWIVTQGDYSSKWNVAAFTSEEAAEAFCRPQWDYHERARAAGYRHSFYDRYEIETLDLDPATVPTDPRLIYSVTLNIHGDATYVTILDPDDEDSCGVSSWSNGDVEVRLRADNREQAIKAAAEQRAQFLVEHDHDLTRPHTSMLFHPSVVAGLRMMEDTRTTFLNRITNGDPPTTVEWGLAELDEEVTE